MSLLEATGLSVPGRLEPTSLRLEAGKLACLIGPNGSGKTSLLHALAGIVDATGEVRIDGSDPRQLGPDRRPRTIGFLPTSRDVKWPLAAGDLIRLGGADADRYRDALDLAPLLDRRVDRLSTGERSRVLLARVLGPAPRLLLLDEPAANLDPAWQIRVMALLRALADDGATLLVAMHDLDLAAHHADRLLVMDRGRIVADGEAAAVLNGPVVRKVFGVAKTAGRWQLV